MRDNPKRVFRITSARWTNAMMKPTSNEAGETTGYAFNNVEQGRRETDAEKITICVLAALEHAFANARGSSDPNVLSENVVRDRFTS
jgi:hypothetical protein